MGEDNCAAPCEEDNLLFWTKFVFKNNCNIQFVLFKYACIIEAYQVAQRLLKFLIKNSVNVLIVVGVTVTAAKIK